MTRENIQGSHDIDNFHAKWKYTSIVMCLRLTQSLDIGSWTRHNDQLQIKLTVIFVWMPKCQMFAIMRIKLSRLKLYNFPCYRLLSLVSFVENIDHRIYVPQTWQPSWLSYVSLWSNGFNKLSSSDMLSFSVSDRPIVWLDPIVPSDTVHPETYVAIRCHAMAQPPPVNFTLFHGDEVVQCRFASHVPFVLNERLPITDSVITSRPSTVASQKYFVILWNIIHND